MPPLETPILLPSIPYVSSEEGVQIPPTTPSIFTGTSNPNGLQDAPLGSLFVDISENLIYVKKTAGVSGWKRNAGQMVVPVHAGGSVGSGTANQANDTTFINNAQRATTKLDLTNFSQFRLVAHVVVASASPNSPRYIARYSTSLLTNATDYVLPLEAGAAVALPLAALGMFTTPWTDLAEGAKTDVVVAILVTGGDGVEDPSTGQLSIQFR